MDSDIENLMKSCSVCQELWPAPAAAPLHSWECPSQPWSRIHLDFAGPFWDTCFDTDLKWSDILITQSITAAKTIEKLQIMFANSQKGVTDNGTSLNFNCSCLRMAYSSHYYGTLPSIKQWPPGMGCANLQMWFQSYPRWPIQERLSKCTASCPILLLGYHLLSCSGVITWGRG